MNILVFIPSMIGGGAERVTSILCNEFVKRGHTVSVATDLSKGHYPLNRKVHLLSVYGPKYKSMPFGIRQLYVLHKAKALVKSKKPQIVIAVMPAFYLLARLATFGTKIPLIASDHTSFLPNKLMRFNFIRQHLYGFANALTILTQYDYQLLGRKYPNKIVIYNPLTFNITDRIGIRPKVITAIGRLDVWEVKGFDLLLKIWTLVTQKHPDWILQIAGTGNENSIQFLNKIIRDKGIENSVHLLGFVDNIENVLKETSIFVLTSRIEGFPMSLIEAMSQGCACISFAIKGIIREIITTDIDGIIIPDGNVQSFVHSLDLLIEDEEFRYKLANNALISVKRFSPDNIADDWENLFNKLVRNLT